MFPEDFSNFIFDDSCMDCEQEILILKEKFEYLNEVIDKYCFEWTITII